MPVEAGSELFDAPTETLPREQLRALQGELLERQVAWVWERSPLLRARYQEAGVRPSDVRGLDDLHKLPLVTKEEVRVARAETGDPFGGILCVPRSELAFVNHSTGTSGAPTVFGTSAGDVERMGELFARALYSIGMRAGDATPISGTTYWHGVVIGYDLGARRIGVTPVRIGAPNPSCVQAIATDWSDFAFDHLRTYIPELELPFLRQSGIRLAETFPSARFVYAGFDVSNAKRKLIEDAFGLPYRNTVGSGDQFFAGGECRFSAPAHHMPEDHFVFEVLDVATGEPVAPGTPGELVLSNLRSEACPILRYRMEDVVVTDDSPCACGRTHLRMRVLGRMAWSVDVAGRRVFSGEVEDAVWSVEGLAGLPYQLLRSARQPQERLVVRLGEPDDQLASGPRPGQDALAAAAAELGARLGVEADVAFAEPEQIGLKGPIKMQRVVDVP